MYRSTGIYTNTYTGVYRRVQGVQKSAGVYRLDWFWTDNWMEQCWTVTFGNLVSGWTATSLSIVKIFLFVNIFLLSILLS